jgi:hypothetical protein
MVSKYRCKEEDGSRMARHDSTLTLTLSVGLGTIHIFSWYSFVRSILRYE